MLTHPNFSGFLLIDEYYFHPKLDLKFTFDFHITYQETFVASIEVCGTSALNNKFNKISNYIDSSEKKDLLWFYILTDNSKFIVFDTRKDLEQSTLATFDKLADLLNHLLSEIQKEKTTRAHLTDDALIKLIEIWQKTFKLIGFTDLSQITRDSFSYNGASVRFNQKKSGGNLEHEFFRKLLGAPPKFIYRYTSLISCFNSLARNELRLNGLVGMNDRSEINYAEKYLEEVLNQFVGNASNTIAKDVEIDDINLKFIASCSDKKDDLTQWRLYANDSAGACFTLQTKENIPPWFFVSRVSYADPVTNKNQKLEIISTVLNELQKQGIVFRFKKFKIWKHFFKPSEYATEQEVRILYLSDLDDRSKKHNVQWNLTSSHQILNPYIQISFAELPVFIKNIRLGPKCPEQETNLNQFRHFIKDKPTLANVKILPSKIENYR